MKLCLLYLLPLLLRQIVERALGITHCLQAQQVVELQQCAAVQADRVVLGIGQVRRVLADRCRGVDFVAAFGATIFVDRSSHLPLPFFLMCLASRCPASLTSCRSRSALTMQPAIASDGTSQTIASPGISCLTLKLVRSRATAMMRRLISRLLRNLFILPTPGITGIARCGATSNQHGSDIVACARRPSG